jgi:hypothetical protein
MGKRRREAASGAELQGGNDLQQRRPRVRPEEAERDHGRQGAVLDAGEEDALSLGPNVGQGQSALISGADGRLELHGGEGEMWRKCGRHLGTKFTLSLTQPTAVAHLSPLAAALPFFIIASLSTFTVSVPPLLLLLSWAPLIRWPC